MTADSTISFSHFHGARSVPSTTGACSSSIAGAAGRVRRRLVEQREVGLVGGWLDSGEPRKQVVRGRRNRWRPRRRCGIRHLGEREIFREPRRGEALDRAPEKREERAARWVGPAGAPIEPRRNPRTRERVADEADVIARRPHEHRHLVEGDSGARFVQDPPCDLDALAPFAGRRKEPHVAERVTFRRLTRREQVALERGQIGCAGRLEDLGCRGLPP